MKSAYIECVLENSGYSVGFGLGVLISYFTSDLDTAIILWHTYKDTVNYCLSQKISEQPVESECVNSTVLIAPEEIGFLP